MNPRWWQLILVPALSLFLHPDPILATDLINPDFEELDPVSGTPSGWSRYTVSTLSVVSTSSSDLVQNGTRSAILSASNKSTKYLYQQIPIISDQLYQFSLKAKILSSTPRIYLKTVWFSDVGENLQEDFSTEISSASSDFAALSISQKSPPTAKSVSARIIIYPQDSRLASVVIDNALFQAIPTDTLPTNPSQNNSVNSTSSMSTQDALSLTANFESVVPIVAGTPFKLSISVSHALPNFKYFVKCLGGKSTAYTDLHETQTFNQQWLNGNASWILMPYLITNSDGQASLTLSCIFDLDSIGNRNLYVRAKPNSSDDFENSNVLSVTINPISNIENPFLPPLRPITLPIKESSSSAEVLETSPSANPAIVLGTSIRSITSKPEPLDLLQKHNSSESFELISLLLGTGGFALITISIYLYFRHS